MKSVYFGGRQILVLSGEKRIPSSPDRYGQATEEIDLDNEAAAESFISPNFGESAGEIALSSDVGDGLVSPSEFGDTEQDVEITESVSGSTTIGKFGDIAADVKIDNISDGYRATAKTAKKNAEIHLDNYSEPKRYSDPHISGIETGAALDEQSVPAEFSDIMLSAAEESTVFAENADGIRTQNIDVIPDESNIVIDHSFVPFVEPSDGNYSTVYISMNDAAYLSLDLWLTITSGALLIEWGDGSSTRRTSTGRASHTYAKNGDYAIIIRPESGTVYTLGRYSTTVLSNYSLFGFPPSPSSSHFDAFQIVGYGLSIVNGNTFRGGNCRLIKILDGPSSIEFGAFSTGAKGTVDLPATITEIKRANFPDDLEAIIIRASTPPANQGFLGMSNPGTTVPVYVPADSVQAYKDHADWAAHADYIFPIQE